MPSTNLEQLLLELTNEARLDPMGNAARYIASYSPLTSADPSIQSAITFFAVDGVSLLNAYATLQPADPLAFNDALAAAARTHDQRMIAADQQAHQLAGEADPFTRMTSAGYQWNIAGENIFAFATSVLYAQAGFMIDWGNATPGHRNNIMNRSFREVGIGILAESNPATSVGPLVVTEDFGNRASLADEAVLLGVAFNDTVIADNFYSVGEGISGLQITVGADTTQTSASGGYALVTAATGAQTITFSGGGLAAGVTFDAVLAAGRNYKLDVVNAGGANPVLTTSLSGTMGGGASVLRGLGVVGLSLATGDGAQTIFGTKGKDTINGGGGNDTLLGGLGNDSIDGGSGTDFVSYLGDGRAVVLDLAVGTASSIGANGWGVDALAGIENVIASGFADKLTGDAADNWLQGGNGNDTLTGGAGADTLDGGAGTLDTVDYGPETGAGGAVVNLSAAAVTDVIGTVGSNGARDTSGAIDSLTGIERIIGTAHGDWLLGSTGVNIIGGGDGADTIESCGGADTLGGGTGLDTLSNQHAGAAVTVDLALTVRQNTLGGGLCLITGFENLIGSGFNDTLIGTAGDNRIEGLGGDDRFIGHVGSDTLDGGSGVDFVAYGGAGAAVQVNLAAGTATGGGGTDTLIAIDGIVGSAFADILTGDGFGNIILGGGAADVLTGAGGIDTLTGGAGADRFLYTSLVDCGDHITDFASGVDAFKITAAAFGGGLVAGAPALLQLGTAATGGSAAFVYSASSGNLLFDADGAGAGAAVLVATLDNKPARLTALDIKLV